MTIDDIAMIRHIFFDMEGTIFQKAVKMRDDYGHTAPGMWHLIAEHLGPEALAEENKTKEKWNRGTARNDPERYAGYVEWMEDTIKIHQKYGLTKDFFDKVMAAVDYWPGVKETFEVLRKKGIRTTVISGGFKAQVDRCVKELKMDHGFGACEYLWDDKGRLVHWNLLPCDYEGKLGFMKLIMKEHGLTEKECAFVGDGKNDISLAKAFGSSVAFNGAKELQAVSIHSVNQGEGKEDFKAVLPLLGIK